LKIAMKMEETQISMALSTRWILNPLLVTQTTSMVHLGLQAGQQTLFHQGPIPAQGQLWTILHSMKA